MKKTALILNGPAGSGKDAIGESVYQLLKEKNVKVTKVSFKDTLFELTAKSFGIDIKNFHTEEFYGRLAKEQPKSNLKVDDQFFYNLKKLYVDLNSKIGFSDNNSKQLEKILNVRNLKDDSLEKYFKTCNIDSKNFINGELSPRQALILLSEVFIKPIYGEDFFGIYTNKKLQPGINIITDGGFMEELKPMLKDNVNLNLVTILSYGFGKERTEELKNFNNDSRNYFQLLLTSFLSQSKNPEDIKKSEELKKQYKEIFTEKEINEIISNNKDYISSESFNQDMKLYDKIKPMKITNFGNNSLEEIAQNISDVFNLTKYQKKNRIIEETIEI